MQLRLLTMAPVLLAILSSCSVKDKTSFDLGNLVYKDVSSKADKVLTIIPPHNIVDGYEYNGDGIRYIYTLDRYNRINYLSVSGEKFITPEGIKDNDPYSKIIKTDIDAGRIIQGYGYVVKLRSGWNALFSSTEILETNSICDTCKVVGFYKKNDLNNK